MTDAAPKTRRKRAPTKPKPEEAPPVEATQVDGPGDQPPVDGVAVIKVVQEDGSVRTAIQLLGSVQVTEVQTLLELGVKDFREAVGLGQPQR